MWDKVSVSDRLLPQLEYGAIVVLRIHVGHTLCIKYSTLKSRISAFLLQTLLPNLACNIMPSLWTTSNKASPCCRISNLPHAYWCFGSLGTNTMLLLSGWSCPCSSQTLVTSFFSTLECIVPFNCTERLAWVNPAPSPTFTKVWFKQNMIPILRLDGKHSYFLEYR